MRGLPWGPSEQEQSPSPLQMLLQGRRPFGGAVMGGDAAALCSRGGSSCLQTDGTGTGRGGESAPERSAQGAAGDPQGDDVRTTLSQKVGPARSHHLGHHPATAVWVCPPRPGGSLLTHRDSDSLPDSRARTAKMAKPSISEKKTRQNHSREKCWPAIRATCQLRSLGLSTEGLKTGLAPGQWADGSEGGPGATAGLSMRWGSCGFPSGAVFLLRGAQAGG